MRNHYKNMATNIPQNPIQQQTTNMTQANNMELFKKKASTTNNMQGTKPYVGVVDVPELTKTPITDTLIKRDKEMGVKPSFKQEKKKLPLSLKLMGLSFLGATGVVISQILKLLKKVK